MNFENAKTMRGIWGLTLLFLTAVMTVALFRFDPPEGSREMLSMVYGGLMVKLKQIQDFYFSSSDGSKQKQQLLGHEDRINDYPNAAKTPGPFNPG